MKDLTIIAKSVTDNEWGHEDIIFYWTYTEQFRLKKFDSIHFDSMQMWDDDFSQYRSDKITRTIADFLNEMDLLDKDYNFQII